MRERRSCENHPEREGTSRCHACGKYFCLECVVEGPEYYYCKAESCQVAYSQALGEPHHREVTAQGTCGPLGQSVTVLNTVGRTSLLPLQHLVPDGSAGVTRSWLHPQVLPPEAATAAASLGKVIPLYVLRRH